MKTQTQTLFSIILFSTLSLWIETHVQAQNFSYFDSLAMEDEKKYSLSDSPKSIHVNYYTEITNMSPKTGVMIGYSTPGYVGDWELGGFYQASSHYGQDRPQTLDYEQSFYGLFASCTLIDGNAVELDLQVRTGMVNHEHFKIVPSVLGKVRVIDRLSLNAGLSTRSMSLTLMGGLTWKFRS